MKLLKYFILVVFIVITAVHGAELKKTASGKGGALLLSGKYLYAVLDKSLCTFDVSDPRVPVKTSETPAAGNRQMVSSGKYLYLSCRARGVQIFSLKNPASPQEVSRFFPSELATGLTLSGNVLAVTLRIFGVEFFDVSNPAKVRYLGKMAAGEAQSAVFAGNRKIVVGDWGRGSRAVIADVSNPSRPRVIASAKLDGQGDGVFVQGNHLYCATGGNSKIRGGGHGLEIFDITNWKQPRKLGGVKFARKVTAMPDWWQVAVVNNTAFVADTENGVYVVDVSNKTRPEVVENIKIPQDSASQIAPGNQVVYVSGQRSGLYLFETPRARAVIPEKNAEVTAVATNIPPPAVPNLHNIQLPGFVWSIAGYGTKLYAACGEGGVKEFSISPDGNLTCLRDFPGFAMDCTVSEKLLIVAGDRVLKIYDRNSGKLIKSLSAAGSAPYLQVRLLGDLLCCNGKGGRLYFLNISKLPQIKNCGSASGGGLLYGDMLPERSVNGKFPVNWHARFVRWYDQKGKNFGQLPKLYRRSTQRNGITEINGKFLLLGRKEGILLSPEAPDKFQIVTMHPVHGGIPTSDGKIVAVSSRQKGEVYFYKFDGKRLKEEPKRRIKLPGAVIGRVVFHNQRAYIPAGRCGIYFEK